MAGHSKFKNIMHRKGAQDAKRAKVFNRLAREITVAVKTGGGPEEASNPRLRTAIAAAKAQSMPKDRIQRAIQVGIGGGEGDDYEEIRYEGYGPGGVALIVEAMTNNRNRTAADIRSIFSKNGGNLGETNSVAFSFDRVGQVLFNADGIDFDELMLDAAEAGADDAAETDGQYEVITPIENFHAVASALGEKYGDPAEAALIWRPNNTVSPDEDTAQPLFKLIDALEDNDDVQSVHANFELSDEVMERLVA